MHYKFINMFTQAQSITGTRIQVASYDLPVVQIQ